MVSGALAPPVTAVPATPTPSVTTPAEVSPTPPPPESPTATPATTPGKASASPSATATPATPRVTPKPAATKTTSAAAPSTKPAVPPTSSPLRYVTGITPVKGGVTISDGWNGTRVYLIRKHFGTDAPTSKGGTYNADTKAKVLAFQQSHGLPATGKVDAATWDALDTGHSFTIDAYQVQPTLPLSASADQRRDTMIDYALAQRGSRYAWGGAGPYELGFDCSGLVLQAIYAAGYDPQPINVVKHAEPTYRTSQQLYAHKSFLSIPIAQRQRGDLIFFGSKAGVVHHVAIYLGNGTMMEAYNDTAAIRAYTPQYGSSYVLPYAKRVFR